MSSNNLVLLFPGQGAYRPGSLKSIKRHFSVVEETLEEIDPVCLAYFKRSPRNLLLDSKAPSLEELLTSDPDMLQMAIYAASVCAYRVLEFRGCRPSVLVGHSLGEIAALVCAGAFSARQGAEIMAARSLALEKAGGLGYMAALSAPSRRCASLIDALDSADVCIAVDNGNQTVVSGTSAGMDRLAAAAQAIGISFVKLAAAYPFHSHLLTPLVENLKNAISRHTRAPLRVAVYSPILERAYQHDEDLAAALSSHLVLPVGFAQAIRHLAHDRAQGEPIFVEVGASTALVKLAKQVLNDPKISAFTTLTALSGKGDSLDATLAALESKGLLRGPAIDLTLLGSMLPEKSTQTEVAQFWQASGDRILAHVNEEWRRYQRAAAVPDAVTPMTPLPLAAPAAPQPISSAGTTAMQSSMTQASLRQPSPSRGALQQQIIALFAEAMEYPAEVFTEEVALEAELGIDSVKQMELLGKLESNFQLPQRPDNFRLSDYGTLGQITDFVYQAVSQVSELVDQALPEPASVAPALISREAALTKTVLQPANAAAGEAPGTLPTRGELQREIVALFAEAMEYPSEVFTEDVELEAELGIDSVKQMELLGKLEARYQLPARSDTFRLGDYGTLGKITDFVHQALTPARQLLVDQAPTYAVG